MKISYIIDTILNPTNKKNIVYSNNLLEIMNEKFESICTVSYNVGKFDGDTNCVQYSSRFSKYIKIDKRNYGIDGEYCIHTSLDPNGRFHSEYDMLRGSFGDEFEGIFFQHSLTARITGNDIDGVYKMIKFVNMLLSSPIQTAKIEFHDMRRIEID